MSDLGRTWGGVKRASPRGGSGVAMVCVGSCSKVGLMAYLTFVMKVRLLCMRVCETGPEVCFLGMLIKKWQKRKKSGYI